MKIKYQIYQTEGVKNGSEKIQKPIRNERGHPIFETLIENADWISMELLSVNKFVRTSTGRLIKINNVYLQTGGNQLGYLPGSADQKEASIKELLSSNSDSYLVVVGHEVFLEGSATEDGKMF